MGGHEASWVPWVVVTVSGESGQRPDCLLGVSKVRERKLRSSLGGGQPASQGKTQAFKEGSQVEKENHAFYRGFRKFIVRNLKNADDGTV